MNFNSRGFSKVIAGLLMLLLSLALFVLGAGLIISVVLGILIGIAFLVATPVAYWLMNDWLDNFVYKTNISVITVVAPIFLAALLTLVATAYQTIRASNVNPVECLKDE